MHKMKKIVLGFFMCLAGIAFTAMSQTQPANPTTTLSDDQMYLMERCADLSASTVVGLVSFHPDVRTGYAVVEGKVTTKPVEMSQTGFYWTANNTTSFRVAGRFEEIQTLAGNLPPLGKVDVYTQVREMRGVDENFKKLQAFSKNRTGKKTILLMFGDEKAKAVPTDFYFLGPIAEIDQLAVTDFVKTLLKNPQASWTAKDRTVYSQSENLFLKTLATRPAPSNPATKNATPLP